MEELLDKAIDGDEDAYGEVVKLISDELFDIAMLKLSNREDALEAIQETLLNSFKYLHTLKDTKFFKTWIVRILLNECKKVYVSKSKQLNLFSKIVSFINPNRMVDMPIEKFESDIHFNNMISILNEEEKDVFILYFKYGYTTNEIAYILQRNSSTVRSQIARGKDKIKNNVKEGEYNESGKSHR